MITLFRAERLLSMIMVLLKDVKKPSMSFVTVGKYIRNFYTRIPDVYISGKNEVLPLAQ